MFLCCFGDKCCVIPTQHPGRTCPVTAQPHNENMKEQQAAQFSLSDFIGPQEAFHIARVNISSPGDLSMHTHDYAETFWVESGTGIHHVNGYRMKLQRGDLVMMRPEDVHTFTSVRGTLTIVMWPSTAPHSTTTAGAISTAAARCSGRPTRYPAGSV